MTLYPESTALGQDAPIEFLEGLRNATEVLAIGACQIELTSGGDPLVIYANGACSTYFTRADGLSLAGFPLSDWFPKPEWLTDMFTALFAGRVWYAPGTVRLEQPTRELEIRAIPDVIGITSTHLRAMILFSDINMLQSDRKARQMAERSRIMMESLGAVCHAIGQPTTVLLSTIEMLQMGLFDKKGQEDAIAMCHGAVLEIRDLLRQLHDKRQYAIEQYRSAEAGAELILSLDGTVAGRIPKEAIPPADEPPPHPGDQDDLFDDGLFDR